MLYIQGVCFKYFMKKLKLMFKLLEKRWLLFSLICYIEYKYILEPGCNLKTKLVNNPWKICLMISTKSPYLVTMNIKAPLATITKKPHLKAFSVLPLQTPTNQHWETFPDFCFFLSVFNIYELHEVHLKYIGLDVSNKITKLLGYCFYLC